MVKELIYPSATNWLVQPNLLERLGAKMETKPIWFHPSDYSISEASTENLYKLHGSKLTATLHWQVNTMRELDMLSVFLKVCGSPGGKRKDPTLPSTLLSLT